MDKKKYPRANYRINYFSSEDPEYPASQLLLQSPDAKGWVSKRFCSYPQIIILELVEPTVIKQISILSHHSKIATKIEIQARADASKDWKRLGHMSLESNANTNYQARQLRTVKINDMTTLQMRFTLHANYVNNHNIFNQVGIVSLCAFGQKLTSHQGPANLQSHNSKGQYSTQFDKNTMNKLRSLEIEKKQAIDRDDFERAKEVKEEIQRIRNIGYALMELEEKKQEAIRNENFDDAKIINDKIKRLRDSSGGGPNVARGPSSNSNQYYKRARTPNYQEQEESIAPISNQTRPPPQKSPIISQKESYHNTNVNTGMNHMQRQPIQQKKEDPDDRPIQVKNTNPYQDAYDEGQEDQGGQPTQLEPLGKQLRAQCSEYFHTIDEEIFRHIFSKNHMNRETGVQMARQEIQRSAKNKDQLVTAGLFVVRSTIDDKVVGVLTASLELLEFIIKRQKPQQSPQNSNHMEYIMDKMGDYLGHNTPAVKNLSSNLFEIFPQYQITNKDMCYRFLTMQNAKREKPPKILTGRLRALELIVTNFQLGKNYQDVIRYAVKYVDDKNNEVRTAAMNLIATISKDIGYGTLQGYLKNVRPQIVKSIEERVGDGGSMGQDRPIKGQNSRGLDRSRSKDRVKFTSGKEHDNEQPMQGDNEFIQVTKPHEQQVYLEYVCEFCQRYDKKFENENYRDLHLFKACPMISICEQCDQAIQISCLTSHQVGQCKNSKYFKKCPRCKEAVHQRTYKAHVQSKECIPAKAPAVANRCPLCHLDIQPGANGWKTHLVDEGCDNNPRK